MGHHALPEQAAQLALGRAVVLVLGEAADLEDTACNDQNAAAGILNQGHLLRVEEHQRLFDPNMLPEAFEQRAMIALILDQVRFEAELGLKGLAHILQGERSTNPSSPLAGSPNTAGFINQRKGKAAAANGVYLTGVGRKCPCVLELDRA